MPNHGQGKETLMATTAKPPVLVVLQLSCGNDYMNTVVPYKDPLYWDYRPRVALPEDQILLLDNDVGLRPSMFRALVAPGVPVACVDDLDTYGLLTGITPAQQRAKILEKFAQNYSPVIGTDEVMKYLGQTGLEAMDGADILKVAPQKYSSTVQYPNTSIATKLKGIAQVHFADLGSRVFYCDHLGFDTHANQMGVHATLWTDVSNAIEAFFADLREHNAADNVLMFLFTEFGRRVRDNGSGTDHGAGGAALRIWGSGEGG